MDDFTVTKCLFRSLWLLVSRLLKGRQAKTYECTVITLFFVVEIFSDGSRYPKICYTNIIPIRRIFLEIFLDGYAYLKFIPYEILSHEN